MIRFTCECGREFHVADEQAGKKGKCPACGAVNLVPEATREIVADLEIQGTAEHQSLSDQLRSLQRANRIFICIALIGPVLAVISALGINRLLDAKSKEPEGIQQTTHIIEAHGLVIRDEKGKIRASLGYDGEHEVALKMFDDGELRTEHRIWHNGVPATIYYWERSGPACVVGGGALVPPSVEFYDQANDERSSYGLFADGTPHFSMSDRDLRTRIQVGINKQGIPNVDLFDTNNEYMPLLDKQGKPIK